MKMSAPVDNDIEYDEKIEYSDDLHSISSNESLNPTENKETHTETPVDLEKQTSKASKRNFKKYRAWLFLSGVFALFIIKMFACFFLSKSVDHRSMRHGCSGHRGGSTFTLDTIVNTTSSEHESFEITLPARHSKSPVFVETLMRHTFGDSWGKPVVFEFEPWQPEEKEQYNFIELQLKTNIEGTQYDRLLHVFINNITVWRSSTVEPLNGAETHSVSVKDVTRYIKLFKDNKSLELRFQLDNLVNSRLTGEFDVELNIKYFNLPEGHETENVVSDGTQYSGETDRNAMIKTALLNYVNPYSSPDYFEPVVVNNRISPLLYFPHTQKQRPYSHSLKSLFNKFDEQNKLSHVSVELFISGNAAEEFWYSNVLDKYAGKFDKEGHHLLGHGPMRILNVYLTNVSSIQTANEQHHNKINRESLLVHQSIPTPVIFSGGISPALWKPVVSVGAFDLKPIDIDLTPYMGKLFNSPDEEWFLEFEIVSANEDSDYKTTVGNNWIISGNLMVWNPTETPSNEIKYFGDFKTTQKDNFDVQVKEGSDSLKQNVTSHAVLVHQHKISFRDTEYDLVIHHINNLVSNQTYTDSGDKQGSVLTITYEKMFVLENEEEQILIEGGDKQKWEHVGTIKTIDFDKKNSELTYSADSILSFNRSVFLDDKDNEDDDDDTSSNILEISASQVGSSKYTLSPKGNNGVGNGVHSVSVSRTWPWEESYKRTVIVSNNKVIIDLRD